MKTRSLPFTCAIAAKTVGISLRHGGGLQEPAGVYVRCDERDCQYVDLNQPPCPLRVDMFADASDDSVARYIATHAGKRVCYACLTEVLGVTHEQVRRASWRLKDVDGFSIKPSRCVECHRRRVTIGVAGNGVSDILSRAAAPPSPVTMAAGERPAGSPLVAHLKAQAGFFFCAHCLARAVGSSPAIVRDAMWTLEAQECYTVRTSQCVSCLLSKRVIRYDPPSHEVDGARRVVELLLKTPGTPVCTSCLAFTTDMALPDVRRTVTYLADVPDFQCTTAACSVCGRWQNVVMSAAAHEDAERVDALNDALAGTLRYRGFRIDLLSFRTGEGWRPFALVKTVEGALVPAAPALMFAVVPSKAEADEMAAVHARDWIDKRVP